MRIAILIDESGYARCSDGVEAACRYPCSSLHTHIYSFGDTAREETHSTMLATPRQVVTLHDSRFHILQRRLRLDGIGALHVASSGRLALMARGVAYRLQVPFIFSHDGSVTRSMTNAIASTLARPVLRRVPAHDDAVLVPAEAARARLVANGWDEHRVHVWGAGVDVDQFSPARRSREVRSTWGVSDGRPAILCSAPLAAHRRELLPALSEVLREYRIPHQFIVTGNCAAADHVHRALPDAFFTGPCSLEAEAVAFASADIVLAPGSSDLAWNTALKAQASGVPVVVTETTGAAEFFAPGKTGYACRADSVQDFAWRLGQLLVDPARRAAFSSASRLYAMNRSWMASVPTLFEVYAGVLRVSPEHPAACETANERLIPAAAFRAARSPHAQ